MCYREGVPTLNLENIEIACLTGDNGHGKTALLDSITWAIWGKARARTQEELVHQGQRTMRVDLDFSSHDQTYRVTRIHSKSITGSAGKTELNLSILKDDIPVSIMGNTIRDTEQQIIDLLHMDYDTFISTSYLRQGDADQFTRSRPAERKQILAEVLDLSYYERLEKKSRDRTREIQSSLVANKSLFETRSNDISNKENIGADLMKALQVVSNLTPLEKETNDLNMSLALKKEGLDRDQSEVSDLEFAIKNSSTELD
ncbi:MAG: AAA family ATPase, partial [Chloroflexota bacterium]|nr:AAA family ATPase [Chloroflexota bacterium]